MSEISMKITATLLEFLEGTSWAYNSFHSYHTSWKGIPEWYRHKKNKRFGYLSVRFLGNLELFLSSPANSCGTAQFADDFE